MPQPGGERLQAPGSRFPGACRAEQSCAWPLMDAGEPARSDRTFPSFLWIIEHVWRHNMMDILQVVGASCWPDVDLQPLSLKESWRLRVASAHVFSVVRSRDVALFERALGFLEATYQLLPGLVAAIKHMKIVFGLKTLVIMAMLRDGRGTVDIVSKINRFFPNKLPQYQNRCSQREMFLMRKNHVDFKGLAQALALDKDRLREYIQSEMEQQYGEHYAQKVEDRLLQYLRELEAALPGDTHIDKILKKQSPVTEEEKLLLDVITSDCGAVAATLKKLLLCDVTSCHPDGVSRSPEAKDIRNSRLCRTSPAVQSESFRRDGEVSLERDRPIRGLGHMAEGGAAAPKGKNKTRNIRQFCSKHRRWVRSILQECPDDCSNFTSSPPLFPSSSSTSSSSQDLTPSNLVPGPSDRPPPSTVHQPCDPGCSTSDRLPSSAVQLVDGVSSSEPNPICLDYKPSPSGSSLIPAPQTSGSEDSTSVHDEMRQDERIPISDLPPTRHAGSRLSRRFRQTISRSTSKPSEECPKDSIRPPSPGDLNSSGPGGRHAPKSQSDRPENPGDCLNSGSARRTEPHPEASTTRDGVSPSLLDDVASFSESNQTSPDCDVCCHHPVSPASSSPPSRQASVFEDRSDIRGLPESQESPTSTKLPRKFRQTLNCLTSEPSAVEVLQEPSCSSSSRDLSLSGSLQHPASPSTSQRSEREEMSSESAESSPQPSSSRDDLLPAAPSPSVHLVDFSSSSTSNLSQTSPDCHFGNQQAPSGSSPAPPGQTAGNERSAEHSSDLKTLPEFNDLTPTLCTYSRLSPKFAETPATNEQAKASRKRPSSDSLPNSSPLQPDDANVSGPEGQTRLPPPSSSYTDDLLPAALSPVVQLVNVSSSSASKHNRTSPDCRVGSRQPDPKTPPESQDELDTSSRLHPTRRSSRQLSSEFRETRAAVKQSKASWRRPSNNKDPKYVSCPPSPYGHSSSGSKMSNQDEVTSGASAQTVRPPQPEDVLRTSVLTPIVRLVDICSDLNSVANQVSSCDSVRYSNHRTCSGSGLPPRRTPREGSTSSVRLKTRSNVKTPPESQDRLVTQHKVFKLSSKFLKSSSNPSRFQISCPTLTDSLSTSGVPPSQAPTPLSFCCGNDVRRRLRPHTRRLFQTNPPLRLSLQSQASLLRSNLLQPYVSLSRLEAEERRPAGASAEPRREEEDDDVDSSFDLNELYSDSSGSDADEDPDPDYKPSLKKKRLLLEYENTKMVNKDAAKTKR